MTSGKGRMEWEKRYLFKRFQVSLKCLSIENKDMKQIQKNVKKQRENQPRQV